MKSTSASEDTEVSYVSTSASAYEKSSAVSFWI